MLGADSRTSTGNYIANRVTDKLTPLAENIYVCRSGSAADTQNLSSYVQYFLAQHRLELDQDVGVKTAAQLAKNMVYQNKVPVEAQLVSATLAFPGLLLTVRCDFAGDVASWTHSGRLG